MLLVRIQKIRERSLTDFLYLLIKVAVFPAQR